MSKLFGGKNPFDDDPFFTQSFSSFLGVNPFDHPRPFDDKVRAQRQVTIEELNPGDDDDDDDDDGGGGVRTTDYRKEIIPEHAIRKRNSNTQGMERSFMYQKVAYGGPEGIYYTCSEGMMTGGDGVFLAEMKEEDKTNDESLHTISKGLRNKGHSMTTKERSNGERNSVQTLHNLNEDELSRFEEDWKSNAEKYFPGWGSGFNLLEDAVLIQRRAFSAPLKRLEVQRRYFSTPFQRRKRKSLESLQSSCASNNPGSMSYHSRSSGTSRPNFAKWHDLLDGFLADDIIEACKGETAPKWEDIVDKFNRKASKKYSYKDILTSIQRVSFKWHTLYEAVHKYGDDFLTELDGLVLRQATEGKPEPKRRGRNLLNVRKEPLPKRNIRSLYTGYVQKNGESSTSHAEFIDELSMNNGAPDDDTLAIDTYAEKECLGKPACMSDVERVLGQKLHNEHAYRKLYEYFDSPTNCQLYTNADDIQRLMIINIAFT